MFLCHWSVFPSLLKTKDSRTSDSSSLNFEMRAPSYLPSRGQSINYVGSTSAIFDPLFPLSSFLLSLVSGWTLVVMSSSRAGSSHSPSWRIFSSAGLMTISWKKNQLENEKIAIFSHSFFFSYFPCILHFDHYFQKFL